MKRFFRGWYFDSTIIWLMVGAATLVLAVLTFAFYEANQWSTFKAEHDCKVIARNAGTTGYGVMTNGKMGVVSTAGTTTWRCNDGVDYTR